MIRLLLAVCFLTAAPLWAATTLLDFETDAEVRLFHDEGRATAGNFPVTRETRWATSGQYSLCFRSPKWQSGLSEWPAIELKPPVTDWSSYDRLVLDLTNPPPVD
ncbi:MAG: hypothetical protein WCP21_10545, partial [Armatimonadota bacterium]